MEICIQLKCHINRKDSDIIRIDHIHFISFFIHVNYYFFSSRGKIRIRKKEKKRSFIEKFNYIVFVRNLFRIVLRIIRNSYRITR